MRIPELEGKQSSHAVEAGIGLSHGQMKPADAGGAKRKILLYRDPCWRRVQGRGMEDGAGSTSKAAADAKTRYYTCTNYGDIEYTVIFCNVFKNSTLVLCIQPSQAAVTAAFFFLLG